MVGRRVPSNVEAASLHCWGDGELVGSKHAITLNSKERRVTVHAMNAAMVVFNSYSNMIIM